MLSPRTDLALESLEQHTPIPPEVEEDTRTLQGYPCSTIRITGAKGSAALGRPEGVYHTLDLTALADGDQAGRRRAIQALRDLLAPLLPEGPIFVVGLGNRSITPDAIGPGCVDHLLVTRHLRTLAPEHFASLRSVAALSTGVLGSTGMESGELVQAAAQLLSPAAILAIDALATRQVQRLCATVQLSDTGIVPGSGIGNHRFALSRETLGCPVLSLGVPTIVDGATLCADLLEQAHLPLPDRESLSAAPGSSLWVTPQDIGQRVSQLSLLLGRAISLALQPGMELEELEELMA